METYRVIRGDVCEALKALPAGSVHLCCTSPPYWGLRAYLPAGHPDKAKEVGLEGSVEAYIAKMVEVFREVRRVLRDDGLLVLNLGDSYASLPPGNKAKGVSARPTLNGVTSDAYRETLANSVQQKRNTVCGELKPKDLVGIPWATAFALRADGWYLRAELPWVKRLSMLESV